MSNEEGMMDYGAVLSKAWRISWKNKGLWILGILAGCSASGRGGGTQPTSGVRGYDYDYGEFERFTIPEVERFFDVRIPEEAIFIALLAILCVGLVIALALLVLGVIGQGGLIAGYGLADDGQAVSFGEAFSLGLQNFWKLLGIRIVFWLAGVIIIVGIVLGSVFFGIITLGIGLICLIPLICLLIPLAIAVDGYVVLTMVAAVEEQLGVFDSFGRAWNVIKENLGPALVMALILIVGGGIVNFLVFLPFISIVLPAITGAIIGTDVAIGSGLALSGLCLVLAIPLMLFVSGVLTTFITGSWTLTYRRLTGKAGAEAES
jgi:hypothetical protein